MNIDFEKLPVLEPDQEIIIEFFEGDSSFDNDSIRINNVCFFPNGESEGERDCVNGAIVNCCKNETWFKFYFNEIKNIFDSNGNIFWKNSQTK